MTRFNPIWQPIAANSLWMSLMQVTGEEYGKTDLDYKKHSKLCPKRLQGKAWNVLTVHLLVWNHGYNQQSTIDLLTPERSKEFRASNAKSSTHHMKNKTLLTPQGSFVKKEIYTRKQWQKVQFLAEQFWSRCWKEYLVNLNSRQKWFQPKRNLKIGDIIVQEEVPQSKWPLCRIMRSYMYFSRSTRPRSFGEDKAWI